MKYCCLPLLQGQAIVLQGNYPDTAADPVILADLMCVSLRAEAPTVPAVVVWEDADRTPPHNAVFVYQSKTVHITYQAESQSFHFYMQDMARLQKTEYAILLWQLSVICAGTGMILRGSPVQMIHCSMLEKEDQSLLLLGESGIGKSTSAKRWAAAGGTATADDAVLLEYAADGGILVHRLPTWSACRLRLDGRSYPFSPPLKLKNVLAVSRGEDREYIRAITKAEFYAQLYRCGFYHYLPIAGKLPPEEQKMLAAKIKDFTDILTNRHKPQALFAHLEGSIAETLGDLL